MKKVLIVAYYWPPSGGAGVQRWMKLTKYLGKKGVKPYVLTVDESYASYMQIDNSLEDEIPEELPVYKTKSFEPINIYAKMVGKDKVPTAGFSNVDNESFKQKLINAIRSNFFIPDPRRGWKRHAVKKAKELIRQEGIDTVITTSPPHSTQLIGLALQRKMGVEWISDLRDPWTDIYYYDILGHSFLSRALDKRYERLVLEKADKIITVSQGFKNIFAPKTDKVDPDKIYIVPNGYDAADFKDVGEKPAHDEFIITYTGTMSDKYDPQVFFHATKELMDENPEVKIRLQFVGKISDKLKAYMDGIHLPFEFVPTVPHDEVLIYQKRADLLLLVNPNIRLDDGIVPGKCFEYLASKNKVLFLGPEDGDVAKILTKCNSGRAFNRDNKAPIKAWLQELINDFVSGRKNPPIEEEILKFTREVQAEEIVRIINL